MRKRGKTERLTILLIGIIALIFVFVMFMSSGQITGKAVYEIKQITYVDSCKNITASGHYVMNASIVVNDPLVAGCIKIRANNVLFDCDGYNITGNVTWISGVDNPGISAVGVTNVTIQNCVIKDMEYGVSFGAGDGMSASSNSFLYNTTISGALMYGIWIVNSETITIENTDSSSSRYPFFLFGTTYARWNHNIQNLTSDGKPIIYLKSESNKVYSGDDFYNGTNPHAFYCLGCNNITIQNTYLDSSPYEGISFPYSNNTLLKNIYFNGTYARNLFHFYRVVNTTINNITDNSTGADSSIVFLRYDPNAYVDGVYCSGSCIYIQDTRGTIQNININSLYPPAGFVTRGFYLSGQSSAGTTTIRNVNLSGNLTYGIYASVNKNIIFENIYSNITADYFVLIASANNNNITLKNSSFTGNASIKTLGIGVSNDYASTYNTDNINIIDTDFSSYVFAKLLNLSVEKSGKSRVKFTQRISPSAYYTGDNFSSLFSFSQNFVSVNTSKDQKLNTTAEVTLYNIPFVNGTAYPLVDLEDDGTFTECNSTTNPACAVIDNSSENFVFSTTHLTGFSSGGVSSGGGGGASVPEFSDYAIVFIVLTAIGGFYFVKKRQK